MCLYFVSIIRNARLLLMITFYKVRRSQYKIHFLILALIIFTFVAYLNIFKSNLFANTSLGSIFREKLKSKKTLKSSWKNNGTNYYDTHALINDSVLPSVCVKPEYNKLSWSIHPENFCMVDVYLVWLIKSSIYRNLLRKNIRRFWAQEINYSINGRLFKTRRLFLIGSDPKHKSLPTIQLENQFYNDILQGTFADTFNSVTRKVVVGMKFVREHCSSVQYVVVVDDDAMVAPWKLFQHLPPVFSLQDGQRFGGFFISGKGPVRNKNNRWYVSESEWRCKDYPAYPLGTAYFMSMCTMEQMYEMALELHLFGMDDVLFGGIANELGINVTKLNNVHRYSECSILVQSHRLTSLEDIVLCHGTDYSHDQTLLWSELCHAPLSEPEAVQYYIEYCKSFL